MTQLPAECTSYCNALIVVTVPACHKATDFTRSSCENLWRILNRILGLAEGYHGAVLHPSARPYFCSKIRS